LRHRGRHSSSALTACIVTSDGPGSPTKRATRTIHIPPELDDILAELDEMLPEQGHIVPEVAEILKEHRDILP
jgi:hypothetical protein